MRSKPYWKDPEELAKKSSYINRSLRLLAKYGQTGDTMETVNPWGHRHVVLAMGDVFLKDLPHHAAQLPIRRVIFGEVW